MSRSLSAILVIPLVVGCFNPCHAENPAEQAFMHAAMEDSINPKWLTQDWDEKANKPYVAKALDVERLLQKKATPAVILKRYEGVARKQPTNSLAIFSWVYARYRLVEAERIKKPLSQVCEELYKVLVMAPAPPSAEYTRLRFKVEANTHLASHLSQIGPRLIARYKNDRSLLLCYSAVVGDSNSEAGVHNDYAMVKKFPKDPAFRWNLAMDLSTLAWKKRDAKLLDASELQFKVFEKLAPPNYSLRRYLPNAREYIRRKRLRFAGKTP